MGKSITNIICKLYTFRRIYCDFKFVKNSTFKSFKIQKVRISTTLNNTLKSNPPP